MPLLLADFIHHRVCEPICEKSLTLPDLSRSCLLFFRWKLSRTLAHYSGCPQGHGAAAASSVAMLWRNKKADNQTVVCFFVLALPIFPGRHQPSIFGASELNCRVRYRVRYGNGWTLTAISTNFVDASSISFASPFGQSSLISLRLLSKSNPLRWALIWFGYILTDFSAKINAIQFPFKEIVVTRTRVELVFAA